MTALCKYGAMRSFELLFLYKLMLTTIKAKTLKGYDVQLKRHSKDNPGTGEDVRKQARKQAN